MMSLPDQSAPKTPLRWPAPAKLNLFLHVNGRRPDGYHELQTLFIFLDHGDWLEFEPLADTDLLTLSPAIPGVPDEQNLIIRAARLLQGRLPSPMGAHIRLEKVLPMGGGIGSIAGAVLGGLLLGLIELMTIAFLPELTGYKDAFAFVLLIVVLLVKPTGLLGSKQGEKV